jgi:phosphate starvation-inducible PhoH-like protein
MGNNEALKVLQEKLDDIVSFISNNNSIELKDVESILKNKG